MLSIGRCHVLRWFPRVCIAFDLPQLMCDRLDFYLFTFLLCVFLFPSSPDDLDGVCYLSILFIARLPLHQLSCVVCLIWYERRRRRWGKRDIERHLPFRFPWSSMRCVAWLKTFSYGVIYSIVGCWRWVLLGHSHRSLGCVLHAIYIFFFPFSFWIIRQMN